MISNNNTNLNPSYHPPNPCLLLLPRSLMLSCSQTARLCIHVKSPSEILAGKIPPPTARQYMPVNSPSEILAGKPPPPTARQYMPVNSPSEILAGTASMPEEHRHHQQPGNTYRSTVPVKTTTNSQVIHTGQQSQ